jgi:hypothetical protein
MYNSVLVPSSDARGVAYSPDVSGSICDTISAFKQALNCLNIFDNALDNCLNIINNALDDNADCSLFHFLSRAFEADLKQIWREKKTVSLFQKRISDIVLTASSPPPPAEDVDAAEEVAGGALLVAALLVALLVVVVPEARTASARFWW